MTVRFESLGDVKEFVGLATLQPYAVQVQDGDRMVNAKSFMEMFSLRLNEPLRVTAQCSDEEFEALRFEAARFLYI